MAASGQEPLAVTNRHPKEPNPLIEQAWDAIDEGFPERALQQLDRLDGDSGEARAARAMACLALGDLDEAEQHAQQARSDPDLDEESLPLVAWVVAEVALHAGRFEDAQRVFDESRRAYEDEGQKSLAAASCDRLALCADLLGNFDEADTWSAAAHRLDPESFSLPLRLDDETFESIVERATADLPAEFRAALESAEVVIEDVPARELIQQGLPPGDGPDLLGLFDGFNQLERGVEDSGLLPPRIHLYQRNLERACADTTELELEIRVTLYHELAHLLGFDEDGVEGLGLE